MGGRVEFERDTLFLFDPVPSRFQLPIIAKQDPLCVKNNTKKARKRLLLNKKKNQNFSFVHFFSFLQFSLLKSLLKPKLLTTLPPRRGPKVRRDPDRLVAAPPDGALHLEADPESRRRLHEVGQEGRARQKNSDVELAKFEAFLKKEGSRDISALVRGSQRLAYPIRGYWDGVYVL